MMQSRTARAWALGLAMTAFGLWMLFRPTATVDEVDARIRPWAKQGTPITAVAAKLDSLGAERSPVSPGDTELLALWRRTRRTLFADVSIQARFQFDERGALKHYDVYEVAMWM